MEANGASRAWRSRRPHASHRCRVAAPFQAHMRGISGSRVELTPGSFVRSYGAPPKLWGGRAACLAEKTGVGDDSSRTKEPLGDRGPEAD